MQKAKRTERNRFLSMIQNPSETEISRALRAVVREMHGAAARDGRGVSCNPIQSWCQMVEIQASQLTSIIISSLSPYAGCSSGPCSKRHSLCSAASVPTALVARCRGLVQRTRDQTRHGRTATNENKNENIFRDMDA